MRGHGAIAGGRATVRDVLFMAALSAIRWNPVPKAHHRQIIGRGRPGKAAIVARMRRPLGTPNAILQANTPWQTA